MGPRMLWVLLMIVATTETGSTYEIRRGIYTKNGRYPQRIWTLKVLDYNFQPANFDELHDELDKVENTDRPEVGKRLYIAGRDGWDYSTRVVSVEEYRELDAFFLQCHAAKRSTEIWKRFGRGF